MDYNLEQLVSNFNPDAYRYVKQVKDQAANLSKLIITRKIQEIFPDQVPGLCPGGKSCISIRPAFSIPRQFLQKLIRFLFKINFCTEMIKPVTNNYIFNPMNEIIPSHLVKRVLGNFY